MKWLRTSRILPFCASVCALLIMAAFGASACNVPVFRYALERWPAENYEAFVFHKGAISPIDQQRLNALSNSIQQLSANLVVRRVDLSESHGMDEERLWRAQTNAMLPWVVVRAPESESADPSLWTGALQDVNAKALLDSPASSELATHLLNGDSVVWLMIDSGDRAQDEAASALLTNETKRLESVLKLPPPSADDPAPRSALPLRIAFSIQHLARDAAGEDLFLRMLLHGEKVEQGKPAVVPVFGRGRALTALSGFELTPKIFSQAAAFLCGACSCEVKELNPGKDLLLAANWESIFTGPPLAAPAPAVIAGESVPIAAGNPTAAPPAPRAAKDVPNERRGLKLLASVTLAFVCIIVLIIGIVMLRSLRQR